MLDTDARAQGLGQHDHHPECIGQSNEDCSCGLDCVNLAVDAKAAEILERLKEIERNGLL